MKVYELTTNNLIGQYSATVTRVCNNSYAPVSNQPLALVSPLAHWRVVNSAAMVVSTYHSCGTEMVRNRLGRSYFNIDSLSNCINMN